eukprot:5468802-Prymnesium_polylepis.1
MAAAVAVAVAVAAVVVAAVVVAAVEAAPAATTIRRIGGRWRADGTKPARAGSANAVWPLA